MVLVFDASIVPPGPAVSATPGPAMLSPELASLWTALCNPWPAALGLLAELLLVVPSPHAVLLVLQVHVCPWALLLLLRLLRLLRLLLSSLSCNRLLHLLLLRLPLLTWDRAVPALQQGSAWPLGSGPWGLLHLLLLLLLWLLVL